MQNLGDYLNKFQKIFSGAKFQKDAVLSIINSVTKMQLGDNDLEVKDYKIVLKGSPAMKSTIYMYKQKILAELKAALGDKAPNDIR